VRRGKELRGAFVLRFFAVERFARALIFAVLAFGVWRFKYSKSSFEEAFDRELPVVRTLLRGFGYDVNHSKLIGLIQSAFTINSRTLTWLAIGAAAYALVELIEGIGLWLLKRWGEYFAMVVTSVGIPYEIYDLTAKITPLRLIAFAINVALVVYLVLTKRLFGVRGGRKAYEARLRTASIIDSELALLAAAEASEMTAARAADPAADAAVQAGGTGPPLPSGGDAAVQAGGTGPPLPPAAITPGPVTPEPVTPDRAGQGSPQ